MCIPRATVSAVSCLVVPAFICIDLLISLVLKINDDDDDDDDEMMKNMRNFGQFWTTSDFDRKYLRNEATYPKSERRTN